MNRGLLLIILLVVLVSPLAAQIEGLDLDTISFEKVSPSTVAWTWDDGVYRSDQGPHTVYLLMNTGGAVDAVFSKDLRSVVRAWLERHPGANAFVMNTISGRGNKHGWTFKPVWVIDKDEILNIELVRRGVCAYHVMMPSPDIDRESPLTSYQIETIQKYLMNAEVLARKEKAGIWADPNRHITGTTGTRNK
jgi:hypothetical protein